MAGDRRAANVSDNAIAAREFVGMEFLRQQVATCTGRPLSAIGDEDDLIGLGLDSIGVMKIASVLCLAGADVTFDELIVRRNLTDWWHYVSARLAMPPSSAPAPGSLDETAPFDLAPMQQAYWIGRSPGQVLATACHYYFEFDGSVTDFGRLEAAVRRVIERHPMLRARFFDDARQQIMSASAWPGLTVRDLGGLSEPDRAQALLAVRERESHRRLPMEQGRGLDVQLSRLGGAGTRLHFHIDMLVCDALSFRILIDELAQLYADPKRVLSPLQYSYPRYLRQKVSASENDRARARRHWQVRLHELTGAPQLPLAVQPQMIQVPRTISRNYWIPQDRLRILAERSRICGVTIPMVLLTAYTEVLGAWSADAQFVVNVPLFDRQPYHADVSRLVGDFTTSILLAVDAAGERTFLDRVLEIQVRFRSDAAHAAYSGVDVLRDLARARPDEPPTAASVVFTSAIGIGEFFGNEAPRQFGRVAFMSSQTAQVWLDCQVTELNEGLLLNWDGVEQLFPEGVLEAMFAAFTGLVDELCGSFADWRQPTPALISADQLRVRKEINGNRRLRKPALLHDGFFMHAALSPDLLALAWGDSERITYGELARRARRLATVLAGRGIAAGDRVAITLAKGPHQVVALLAILYLGAAYVPIGVDHPPRRRARLYLGAAARVAVTDADLHAGSEWPPGIDVVRMEEADEAEELPSTVPVPESSIAYVMFTSGSTGTPKAVAVSHSAAMNTIQDVVERFGIGTGDSVLSVSSLDFDWSVADIFELLSVGGTVVLTLEHERRDAARWAELVKRWGVTLWQSVPALLDMLLNAAANNGLGRSLRLVMLGGDRIGLNLYDRLQEKVPGCRFVGLGGITETAIHITAHEVRVVPSHWRSIPYGRPLTNVRCRVVDGRGCDCPDWKPGELWIGGAGLSAGYVNDPELTKSRFVVDAGERWYRSGDLARYWPDGTLEFLGRADSQVKIRGHRIELEEIRVAIEENPSVTHAFVSTVDTPEPALAAAVVGNGTPIDAEGLKATLRELLPAHMIPAKILILDEFPLTANGKVDAAEIRRRLASSQRDRPEPFEPPVGAAEKVVAAVWSELLSARDVSRTDSFFALGGDSVTAARMIVRLRDAGIRGVEIRRLFSGPRLRDFAAGLRLGEPVPHAQLRSDAARMYEPFPLTEMQRAYWLGRRAEFVLGGVGSHWYWEFDGREVDLERLELAVNRVIERHPMLRAVIDDDGRQRVLPHTPRFAISVLDAVPGAGPCAPEYLCARMAHHVFDPTRWPAFDIQALRYGDGRTRIGLGFDYIFVDALSIMIVLSDLGAFYRDPAARLHSSVLSFRDYVLGVQEEDPAAQHEAERFWRGRLADLPPAPQLPLARNPADVVAPRFERRHARLDRARWLTIKSRAGRDQLTTTAVLATAFAEVLCLWSGQDALTLNFTLFDRQAVHGDVDRIVGEFTSLLLVPYRRHQCRQWNAAARAMQENVALGLDNRSVSGLSVMRERARQEGRSTTPMPIVFTSMLGVADDLVRLSMPFGDYVGGLSQTPQIWLDNQVVEYDGELLINWDFVAELFPPDLIDAMFHAFIGLLRELADADADWGRVIEVGPPNPQQRVRRAVNATARVFASELLHEGFFSRAAEDPNRIALQWGEKSELRYGELRERALRVAAFLVAQGIKPGDAVAVSLPNGPDQVISVLGILAAGAVYAPIGIDQPQARQARMRARAGVRLVLTNLNAAERELALAAPVAVSDDGPAYVIFTSGSTGDPKGVVTSHRAAVNTLADISVRFGIDRTDRMLAVSALDFDLSVFDIFGLLRAGGSVVLVEEESRRDAVQWVRLIEAWKVTLWNSVPALLEMALISCGNRAMPASLRLALVSGDWVPLDLRARLLACAPACRLVALGGATEAAIWSNLFEVEDVPEGWRSIPYGRPLSNQKFRVVNGWGIDCPDWTAGELWIGGRGVALGYCGADEENRDKFVEYENERWYRTGDLGCYWPNGVIEFLGRIDGQIKVGGYRIGYGEIEGALDRHCAVAQSVAVVHSGGRMIAAGVVLKEGFHSAAELGPFLETQLPAYMIPKRIAVLHRLPLTSNGKVDRAAVARIVWSLQEELDHEPPQGAAEEAIAALWAELLKHTQITRDANFFALGGDSLLATQFVEQARRRLGLDCSLRQVLDAPTIRKLANLVGGDAKTKLAAMEEGAI